MSRFHRFKGLPRNQNLHATMHVYLRVAFMALRALTVKPLLKRSTGALLLGRGARILNPSYVSHTGRLVLEPYSELQGISRGGINLGADVSIGRGTTIRPSSYYGGEVGEGLWIGDRSSIGCDGFIGCSGRISIGSDVMIGPGVRVFSENHSFDSLASSIKSQGVTRSFVEIGDNCWIASGVTITAGVRIGSGVVIAAGSVVTRDIPDNSVAGGIPARVLRQRGGK
ncbi:acetyltransferase-like isoleucine patch superfamily enzyme [Cryobacterium sp. CG_9.6]|nr:acetyltransferase-like isoleucine patch superfamily enzyme [Cryobacterium sp. CG_9.6]